MISQHLHSAEADLAGSDMWSVEERGKAMGIYTLGPLLGPVIGPIAGGFIAEYSTWH